MWAVDCLEKKNMKLLQLEQMSEEESFADRKYVNGKFISKPFYEVASKYPDCLIEIEEDTKLYPNWGFAWYKCGENNYIELWRENWDTSG